MGITISMADILDGGDDEACSIIASFAVRNPERLTEIFDELRETKRDDKASKIWNLAFLRATNTGKADILTALIDLDRTETFRSGLKLSHKKISLYPLAMIAADPTRQNSITPLPPNQSEGYVCSRDVLGIILDLGFDINAKGPNGATALTVAYAPEVISLLLERGAKTESDEIQNPSPLHSAIQQHSPEKIAMLLDAGADIEALWQWGAKENPCTAGWLLTRCETADERFPDMVDVFVERGLIGYLLRETPDDPIPLPPKARAILESRSLSQKSTRDRKIDTI